MYFDVIIGNPPYQLEDSGAMASASPLYHKFIKLAIDLKPRYVSMIVPSRWFLGGKGLDEFREEMINDRRLKALKHYQSSTDCFDNVLIGGGVNYFLWSREHFGVCEVSNVLTSGVENKTRRLLKHQDLDVFINDNILFNIASKVQNLTNGTFDKYVSPRDPYHIIDLSNIAEEATVENNTIVYGHKLKGFTSKLNVGRDKYDYKNKLFISYAYGSGHDELNQVINRPFIPEENAVCTGTYLSIGPFKSANQTENAMSYMKTKFFRAMVYALKKTQHGTAKVYRLVPDLDFSKSWTDEELYNKYKLTEDEINYIESNVRALY